MLWYGTGLAQPHFAIKLTYMYEYKIRYRQGQKSELEVYLK